MVVLPRPSLKEEGKAAVPVPSNSHIGNQNQGKRGCNIFSRLRDSKKGKLYLKFFIAAALIVAFASAWFGGVAL